MDDQIYIQRWFQMTKDDGTIFSDVISMPQDEYNALTEDDIAALKQARFDAWVAGTQQ